MNKVSDNQLISVKSYFLKELTTVLSEREAVLYFERCCQSWLGLSKTDLVFQKNFLLSESQILRFLYAIKDFKKHTPLAYVLKEQHFYGLDFKVSTDVLIPRPETEELVDLILRENQNVKNILDIGTGSGCIPISLKKHLPLAEIWGIDISENALKIAKENAHNLGLKVNFICADALNLAKSEVSNITWDILVSNPPYIPNLEKSSMDKNVTQHEPSIALFVPDENPLIFYQAIAEWAINHLSIEGKLYFEIHEEFATEVEALLNEIGFSSIKIIQDLQGKNRMIKAFKN